MKNKWLVIAGIALFLGQSVLRAEAPISTVTFRVIDETGRGVQNANILGTSYWRYAKTKGLTDSSGEFSYQDRVYTDVGCLVEKPGYYRTRGEVWHRKGIENQHPTNTLVVVLKRIIDPVPLTFRRFEALFLPRFNEPVAFDLEIGDWVEPEGKGRIKDVWMIGNKQGESKQDRNLNVIISFSNSLDGAQEFLANNPARTSLASDLMPPHKAAETGFTNNIMVFLNKHPRTPVNMSYSENRCYMFRVRTKTNEVGVITAANVGWIKEDIQIGLAETNDKIGVAFQYYYNTNPQSRSLEPKEVAEIQGKYPAQ